MRRHIHHFLLSPFAIVLLLFSLSGCSAVMQADISPEQHLISEESEDSTPEQTDSSCSYFYFLWGTHAEINKHYIEAEEAFEKALICDPESRYILRRLPVLLIRMGKLQGAAQWLRTAIEKYPDELQDRLLLARLDIRNNEIAEAIDLYNELITLDPKDETLLLRLGYLYSEQNRLVEAEQTFKKALAINPESLFTYLYLARLATQTNKMKEAEKWYLKALSINWSTELAFEVANFHEKQKNYKKAESQYRSILERQPEAIQAGLGLVHALLLQDNEQEAMAVLLDLRKNSADPSQIDIMSARLYLSAKQFDKAAEILKRLTLNGDAPEAAYMLAVIYYQQKKIDESMALLLTIGEEATQFEDSIYLRVRILMERQQDNKAIELIKETLNNQDFGDPGLYTLLASLYMEQKQIQKGYDILDTALLQFPDNVQIYFEYGLLLEQDGLQQKAIALMEKVLELDADHAEALNYLGYTWADNNINLNKALEYVQKANRLKPDNGYILDSLAWVYFRMGNLDLAVQEILKALTLEAEDPNIHEHLGDIYQRQGQQQKALQAFKDAEKRFHSLDDKTRLLEKINALQ